jgi:DNA uptake protein ComE-like DNA-binding protein
VEAPGDDPALLAELARATRELEARRDDEQQLAAELAGAEERLADNQRRTAAALERAIAQLEQVETRAREAEERAERAERLARLRDAETEQAGRLREILDRITAAEQRAAGAEARAREAFARVGEPEPGSEPGADSAGQAAVSINSVSFEQLRSFGLSALEARSLLEHRERLDGFASLDQLDAVAGISAEHIAELRGRVEL